MSYHHKDLKRALIEATLEVVADKGPDAVSVNALARKIGVSSGAPFRHFSSKTDLLVAAAEHIAQDMITALKAASVGLTDPVDIERREAVAYVRYAVEHPGHFRLVTSAAVLEASPMIRGLHGQSQDAMDEAWGGERDVLFQEHTIKTLAAQALVFGLAHMCVEGHLGPISPDDAERLALATTGVLGVGLLER